MANKRVSLKGKGADLFFGDYTPPAASPPDPETAAMLDPSGGPERDSQAQTEEASVPEPATRSVGHTRARRQASVHARTEVGHLISEPDDPTGDPEPGAPETPTVQDGLAGASVAPAIQAESTDDGPAPAAGVGPELLEELWDELLEQATVSNSFRYTEQELAHLTDAIHELKKQHRVKLSKQDVARLGLNLLLRDYQTTGEASLLSQFARGKRQRRGAT